MDTYETNGKLTESIEHFGSRIGYPGQANSPTRACACSRAAKTGSYGRRKPQLETISAKNYLSDARFPENSSRLSRFWAAKGIKGESTKVFVRVVRLHRRRPPNSARRCPFPAVTHPTRRGLAGHNRSTLMGQPSSVSGAGIEPPRSYFSNWSNCTIRFGSIPTVEKTLSQT